MRENFPQIALEYYREHGRHDLPWRESGPGGFFDPYKILVSEIMLQQTQVPRVIPKFHEFLRRFPSVQTLAQAPLGDVLVAWQGLGYNRRAKYLWQAAQMIVSDFEGAIPDTQAALERLPGVGANTAGAILAYAFNQPAVFIETNIRTVFIHHFFEDRTNIPDKAICELVMRTLDNNNPRLFYWALMDYGTYLKQAIGNVARASKTYAKQSKFHGSLRQIRGQALRLLTNGPLEISDLLSKLDDPRAESALVNLEAEGLIQKSDHHYALP